MYIHTCTESNRTALNAKTKETKKEEEGNRNKHSYRASSLSHRIDCLVFQPFFKRLFVRLYLAQSFVLACALICFVNDDKFIWFVFFLSSLVYFELIRCHWVWRFKCVFIAYGVWNKNEMEFILGGITLVEGFHFILKYTL